MVGCFVCPSASCPTVHAEDREQPWQPGEQCAQTCAARSLPSAFSSFAPRGAGREVHCPLQCEQSAQPDGLPLIFLQRAAAPTAATTTTQSTITTMSTVVIIYSFSSVSEACASVSLSAAASRAVRSDVSSAVTDASPAAASFALASRLRLNVTMPYTAPAAMARKMNTVHHQLPTRYTTASSRRGTPPYPRCRK